MNISNHPQEPTEQNDLQEISRYLYAIIYPIVFILGITGNLLSSLLFSITKLNSTSCGIYFLLLAIADSVALIGGMHHCLTTGYRIKIPNASYCRARNFLLYTSTGIASWMVVAISVDRYLKMKFPIKARMYATRKLACIISCVIIVIFIIQNFHFATAFIGDFSNKTTDYCDPNPAYPTYVFFFNNIWPWIDLTTFALLPFGIIVICNAFIIHDQYKRRVKLRKRSLDRSLITLLLVSSISFIVCNLPVVIEAVIYPLTNKDDKYDGDEFAYDLLRLPSYVSLALNFYFYYYSSILFRQQVILLYKRIFKIKARTSDIELSNRIYTQQNRFQQRLESIEEFDEYQQTSTPSLTGSSFISDFYRQ